ncbi:MAG: hypothetical protein IKT99_06280, partial [Oscillospiraceae bacterium]|nr:hypothetical protein [Oscillospiraceae bacterium]
QLDRLGVNVIETSPIVNPKVDALLIKSISTAVKRSVVAVPTDLEDGSADYAWNALKEAKHPRLQVCAPVSAVQMEYLARKKPAAMLEAIDAAVRKAVSLCPEVEFVADDATRADRSFLYSALKTAIEAGAGIVTVCDTAGAMLPDEFSDFILDLYKNVDELLGVTLGVGISNELSMADSCAIAAIRAGVGEVKAASYPIDAASVENLAKILTAKGNVLGAGCAVHMTQLHRILRQISWMFETSRSKNSPFDNGVQDSTGIYLTAHDDLSAVSKVVMQLGYDLSEEDGAKVYEAFQSIASRKETVGARELEAIIASSAMQVPPTYRVETYVITAGNTINATSHVKLQKNGQTIEGIAVGDGPIDASLLAIEQAVGHHYELDDFQIQAVTEGREAMGETIVKLRSGGKLYSGRGISTDILGASIHAYVNALNKIVYEEEGN